MVMPEPSSGHQHLIKSHRDRVLCEVEKSNVIALPGKGGHQADALKTVSRPGGDSEKFYSNGSKCGVISLWTFF